VGNFEGLLLHLLLHVGALELDLVRRRHRRGRGRRRGPRAHRLAVLGGGPPTPLPYPRQGRWGERDRGRGREETIETHPREEEEGGAIVVPHHVGHRRHACRRLGETEREWGELRACFFCDDEWRRERRKEADVGYLRGR